MLIISLFSLFVYAQPVINYADFNPNGTSNVYTVSPIGFTTGLSGENQTWNYSNLTLNSSGTTTSTVVLSAPFANSFPEANYFVKSSTNGSDFYTIYKLTNTKLETLGITTNSSVLVNFSPNPQTQFEFPYNYNLLINDAYSTTNDPNANDPFSIIYDAYGTLITPFGTYNNVIRTKKMDGVFPLYTWYTVNPTLAVLSARFGSGGVNLVTFYEHTNLSINQNKLFEFTISPNPTSNNIAIKNTKNLNEVINYEIYDLTGRVVKKNIANANENINIEELQSGNYVIKISDKNYNSYSQLFIKE